jgi:hypothetical protein
MPVPAQIVVKDANSADQTLNAPLNPGRAPATDSRPTVASNEDYAAIGTPTETAPASDTASSGLNGRLQRVAQRITSLIALVPAALGQTTKAGSLAVTVASDDDLQGKLGSLTETAPGTDTASSGLNGRLQRIAQRLTSLIALVPASLGTKTAAASFPVTLASDGQFVTSIGTSSSAVVANGAAGDVSGYLRTIKDAATDTTTVSPVKIDQTTPGTTDRVSAVVRNPSYETVAASQTDQVMGASGAAGDILSQVLIVPATLSPGAVSIKDGVGSAITIFTGGASSVTTLIPFAVPLGTVAATSWKITTGANVSAIGIGKFS